MAHPNAEVLRRADEAMERGDIEGFFSHYSADVVVHVAGSNRLAGDYTGLDQLQDAFGRFMRKDLVRSKRCIWVPTFARRLRSRRFSLPGLRPPLARGLAGPWHHRGDENKTLNGLRRGDERGGEGAHRLCYYDDVFAAPNAATAASR